ncbi:G beta WD-40 repeats containing protein [Fusarium napiforme]|uniref:G beta WD-40 repeats containing protein n=1 Tax=Fusarium napiforme TaxID=42672 RepID=A0A8H5K731_9HYPO|nr:G beta WD-40 repeats containing protein [Fusarium napiforme]
MSGDNAAFESEDYTVGWVCALPLEMAAARGMLDSIHPNLSHQDPNDINSYVLGEIHGHKIVIACLPAGNYGTSPAATVATNLLRTFKSIRFGLIVGIGGGAPSAQHDIRLGDVVIGQPSGVLGGVVQHDRGKVLPQGGFERTGFQNAPPQLLLAALARLQATHMNEDSQVPEYLDHLVAKSPKRMKPKFKYQGTSKDQLFEVDYDHAKPESPTCQDCDRSRLVHREDREDTDPYFHYGIIASGNQVIKDGKTRQRLSKEYGALCFEMEGAGLYNFPCLVIRGICDYADSHKNKMWQEYAAATAAAFAKELLLFVPPNQVLQEKKLVSELVSNMQPIFTRGWSLTGNRKILDDRPLDLHIVHKARYDSEDVKKSPRCEPGTRARILELIQDWADQDPGLPLLWLIGPAGTGKSTLARSLIDSLEVKRRLIAGYMFERGEQDRNDTNRLFSTLAMQLADTVWGFKESLRNSLEGLDKDAVDKSSLENQFQKLLWDPLESLELTDAKHLARIIIIDALDECERPENLLRLLRLFSKLCTSSKLHLRVLITSRHAPEIAEAFETLLQNNTVYTLELHREFPEDTKSDIQRFLKARFASIKLRRRVQREPWPTTEDLDRLVQLSTTPEPLFIYAATLCRFVSDNNRGPIQQLITWLEQGSKSQLHQIYSPILDQALSGFDEEEFHHKLRFLGTIILLARPLSAQSLTLLLHMDLDDISWWIPRLYAVLHVPPELHQPIQLLHKSFSDFLTSDDDLGPNTYNLNIAEIHTNLAEACIQCMKAKLKQDICKIKKPGTAKHEVDTNLIHRCIPPELEYSCTYWFLHLKRSGQLLSYFTYAFLFDHLLHWVEVLSLLGRLADGVNILKELLEMGQTCSDLRQDFVPFVRDSIRVIVAFITVIEFAPLQIYGSPIFFSPTGSMVRQTFWHQRIPQTGEIQGVETDWSARLQVIQNSGRPVKLHVFSPNGHFLASVVERNDLQPEIQLRNVTTDSRLLAVVYIGKLTIWDVGMRAQKLSLQHHHPVDAIAFSPCGRIIASSARERIQLWDLQTGVSGTTLIEDGTVSALAFTPDGSTLASPQHLWDTAKPREYHSIDSDSQCITRIVSSPDGQRLASVSRDTTIRIWNALTLAPQWVLPNTRDILELSFSADSNLLASLSKDQKLSIWSMCSGEATGFFNSISDVAYSPDGQIVVSAYWIEFGGEVALWEAATGRHLRVLDRARTFVAGKETGPRTETKLRNVSGGHSATLPNPEPAVFFHAGELMSNTTRYFSLMFSPDGQIVAAIRPTGSLYLWDTSTGRQRRGLPIDSAVNKLLFSPDSQLIAALGETEVFLWHVTASEPPKVLEIQAEAAEFFSGGNLLVVAGPADVTVWDVATGSRQHTHGDLNGRPIALCVSSDGRMIGVSSNRQVVRVWNIASYPETHFTLRQKETVTAMAFSPDGKFLATASEHGLVRLWDTSSGTQLGWTIRQEGLIRGIKVLPDELIVSVSDFPPFFNLWNDMKLRTHRYRTANTTTERLLDQLPYDIGLRYDGDWIMQGSENLLWVPPQYRPTYGRVKGWTSRNSATIFIGSVSGRIVRFQCV